VELLGYIKDLPNYNLEEGLEWAKNNMIKGAQYVCRDTPMFAEMECSSEWVH
jgi:hypothetical protein